MQARAGNKKNKWITKNCKFCGNKFQTRACVDNDFCSYDCYNKSKRNREIRLCENCGKLFEVKKSIKSVCCSVRCRYERLSKLRNKQIVRNCRNCGKKFRTKRSSGQKYCSVLCKYESQKTGSTGNGFYATAQWYDVRDYILLRDDFTCQQCGVRKNKGLHVHHKKAKIDGGNESPDNLITLCNSCHGKMHKRRI
jgi:5-methylcytosine-specific restriction endonuclease McrA